MADKTYLTKCPHCGVKFQITLAQMKLADGAVRCGSCLEVFQANENIVKQKKPASPPVLKPKAAPAPPAPGKPAEEGDLFADDLLADLEGETVALSTQPEDTGKETVTETEPSWTPPVQEDDESSEPQWTPPPDASADDDEPVWSLPAEEDEDGDDKSRETPADKPADPVSETNNTAISLGGMELSESLLDDDPFADVVAGSNTFAADEPENSDAADESWAKALLEELEDDNEPAPESAEELSLVDDTPPSGKEKSSEKTDSSRKLATPRKPTSPNQDQDEPDPFDFADEFGDDLGEPFADLDEDAAPVAEDAFDFLNADNDIGDDFSTTEVALSLDPEEQTLDWVDIGKWAGLSLAMCLLLLIQYLTFNFDSLALTDRWRPTYSTACKLFGCDLPVRTNVDLIKGSQLVVRSHPSQGEALVVDMIVFNRAHYPQPFPDLELSFTDVNNNLLASRRFKPEEYLTGEIRGMQAMPVNTPVHISLEIVDPGPEAVNYVVQFYPSASAAADKG